jgi:serine/threonine-protein kinase RsbW
MTDTEQAATAPEDVVEVRVPADVGYVSTLRLTTASLGARCGLTIDDIDDLRLAVDEACALVLPLADADSALELRFRLGTGQLAVETSVRSAGDEEPDRGGFAWTVLGALASSVDVAREDSRLTITVTKSREAAAR